MSTCCVLTGITQLSAAELCSGEESTSNLLESLLDALGVHPLDSAVDALLSLVRSQHGPDVRQNGDSGSGKLVKPVSISDHMSELAHVVKPTSNVAQVQAPVGSYYHDSLSSARLLLVYPQTTVNQRKLEKAETKIREKQERRANEPTADTKPHPALDVSASVSQAACRREGDSNKDEGLGSGNCSCYCASGVVEFHYISLQEARLTSTSSK